MNVTIIVEKKSEEGAKHRGGHENTFTRVRGGWVGEGAEIIPRETVSNLIHE